jgi:gamma-glutamylcyclotransferase (GGCT)/AIG2-like uncharacterized protein YtfP
MLPFSGPTFKLFVYGTLMRGGCRHHALADQVFLGSALTRPWYLLYDLGEHPGMVFPATGGRAVKGELYEVEAARLPLLEELEGAPDWFQLAPVELQNVEGPVFSFFYQLNPESRPLCPGDQWHNQE